ARAVVVAVVVVVVVVVVMVVVMVVVVVVAVGPPGRAVAGKGRSGAQLPPAPPRGHQLLGGNPRGRRSCRRTRRGILTVLELTARSLTLQWTPPARPNGEVQYTVQVTRSSGVIQAEETVAALRLTVGDLRPFTEYTAKVWAQTSVGVPGPVGDLTAVGLNATAVLVQWSRPLEPNGAILRYRVLALVQGTGAIVKEVVLRERTAVRPRRGGTPARQPPPAPGPLPPPLPPPPRPPPATPVSAATPPPAPLFPYANRRLRRAVAVEPGGGDVGDDDGSGGGGERSGLEPRGRAPTPPVPPPVPPPPLPLPRRSRRSPAALAHVQRRDAAAPGTAEQQQQLTVLGDVSGELLALAVTRLPPYSELSFSVSALTVLGEGPSVSVSAWTLQGVPSPVRAVRYETLSPTSVWVTWEPPLHPNGVLGPYTVYVTPLGDASNETRTLTTNGTSATVTGLLKFSSYRLRVSASTGAGESLLTDGDNVFLTTPEDGPDSPPRNVSYVAVSPTQVNVTWLAPERPNGVVLYYEVLYRDAGAGTTAGTTAATLAVTTPSEAVALTGLRKYGLYEVRVRAYTRAGHGNQSSGALLVRTADD
ncbi:unnamed protein product, partial [Lampetra planeri]